MTTKLGRFRLGPAKTRDGREIEIVKLEGHRVYPVIALYKTSYDEYLCGAFNADAVVPNAEPERVECTAEVERYVPYPYPGPTKWHGLIHHEKLLPLFGKRCKVTVEVLDE